MDQIRTKRLSRVDGFVIRTGRFTLVHVSRALPPSVRAAAARYLRRAVHSVTDTYASASIGLGEAIALPRAPRVVVVKRPATPGPDFLVAQRRSGCSPACSSGLRELTSPLR